MNGSLFDLRLKDLKGSLVPVCLPFKMGQNALFCGLFGAVFAGFNTHILVLLPFSNYVLEECEVTVSFRDVEV